MSNDSQVEEKPKEKTKRLSPGAILKQNREAQGLSLETVHEATKIPMDALRGIEEGYTVRTLSPFYQRGFIKIYSKYLGIEVIPDVAEEIKPEEPAAAAPAAPKKEIKFDFDLNDWIAKNLTRERKKQIAMLAGILVGLIVLFNIIVFFSSREPAKPKPPISKIEKEKPSEPAISPVTTKPQEAKKEVKRESPISVPAPVKEAKEAKPAETTKPAKAEKKPPVAVTKPVTLTVRATAKSWLRVKSDDQVVFQSILNKGAVETWTADKNIDISGRNLSQLEFELNGKMLGTLGRKNAAMKRVLVTKDGLEVVK